MNAAPDCPFYSILRRPKTNSIDFHQEGGASMTKQAFKPETDINVIVRRAVNTGEPVPFRPGAQYGDFSILTDYHHALQMVDDAQAHFDNLPSKVRKRFENDPGKLLAFLNDPKNYDEGVELGFYEGPKEKITVPPGTVVTETLKTEDPKK